MSYKTLEVELENGRVRAHDGEMLPASGRALLTLLEPGGASTAQTCGELAERWVGLERLPLEDASDFANDIEQARTNLPPLKSSWD